ncbi:MAG TPA: heme ABC exporter ATP-binding protein CcmA [Steroidobacteraceae bacterium]|nr:heme ABC exporter ATP-binding protein CcmA [Steroidobacteraceae bacterium]
MSEFTLRGENLHLWRGERHVLKGVDLAIGSGEVLQVTGANGAGKTSLLRLLCGLLQPEEGRVLWGGADVHADPAALQVNCLYLGHEPPLKADLTAAENLRYWVGLRQPVTPSALREALSTVGVAQVAGRLVRTLSAGQRRRVALAAVLLVAAPLWLLDEPTTNLDADGQALVGRLIDAHVAGGGLAVAAVHHPLQVGPGRLRQLELVVDRP